MVEDQQVDAFLGSPQGQFLQEQAKGTVQLLQELCQLQKRTKAQKMLHFGRMFLQRHYFLNAATFMYEGLLRLVREITDFDEQCLRKDVNVFGREYKASQTIKMLLQYHGLSVPAKYGRYVKLHEAGVKGEVADYLEKASKLRDFYDERLAPFQEMSRLIDVMDELRNNAAHGFINETGPQTYQNQLKSYFEFAEELEQRHSDIEFRMELGDKIKKLPGIFVFKQVQR